MLVGRWRLADLFAMVAAFQAGGDPMCTDHILYPVIKAMICKYPDIASSLTGPTTPCDALSFAMGLTADPAQLGRVWKTAVEPSVCDPGTAPGEDDCSS